MGIGWELGHLHRQWVAVGATEQEAAHMADTDSSITKASIISSRLAVDTAGMATVLSRWICLGRIRSLSRGAASRSTTTSNNSNNHSSSTMAATSNHSSSSSSRRYSSNPSSSNLSSSNKLQGAIRPCSGQISRQRTTMHSTQQLTPNMHSTPTTTGN
ncbi:hypothetical protein H4S06_002709 [Coemansia sp. BCRC 34490]|nr:hypothetical protein H4S06_002709 [Coemansia sp. BCRC 34490]